MTDFGPYVIERSLACGGMCEVVLARRLDNGSLKKMAIKRVLSHLKDDPQYGVMLEDEGRLMRKLRHRNIVRVFGFEHIEDEPCLVSEYVEGRDAAQLVNQFSERGERVPVHVAVWICAEVAAGLHYAHELCDKQGYPMNVVHRDVAPDNILVSDRGSIRLTDFGIARHDLPRQQTAFGMVKGKPAYMSPEQVLGGKTDRRTDIFSLGTVLYEILTGQPCFGAETTPATLRRIEAVDCRPLREVRKDVPADVCEVVARMLQKDPARRFDNAQEVRDALHRVLERLGGQPRSDLIRCLESRQSKRSTGASMERLWKRATGLHRRTRRGLLAITAVAAGILTFTSVTHLLGREVGAAEMAARIEASQNEPMAPATLPDKGMLRVLTDPPGARVSVDGIPRVGRSPTTLAGLEIGKSYALRVELDGYVHKERRIVPQRGRTVGWEVSLIAGESSPAKPLARVDPAFMATFVVNSTPPTQVTLNGEAKGWTPVSTQVPPGTLSVKLNNDRLGVTKSFVTEAIPGEVTRKNIVIKKGTLRIDVRPWADIYLGDRKVGRSPLPALELYEGTHVLRLVNPRLRRDREIQVVVKAGETHKLVASLAKDLP